MKRKIMLRPSWDLTYRAYLSLYQYSVLTGLSR